MLIAPVISPAIFPGLPGLGRFSHSTPLGLLWAPLFWAPAPTPTARTTTHHSPLTTHHSGDPSTLRPRPLLSKFTLRIPMEIRKYF
ncbi:hypothetical protein PG995_007199 [Apiospora arundinis]|uniref:Uncharacterized protein n=1 Tax=Apiospora arundinis TaxID=335852 RepID=A0ABR2JHE0_9PEZI